MTLNAPTIYDHLPLTVRGYQKPHEERKYKGGEKKQDPDTWYLCFDTETLVDPSQQLRFGVAHLYKRTEKEGKERFLKTKSYLFYEPLTTLETEVEVLKLIAIRERHILLTVSQFREEVFLPWVCLYKAYCVGFNLPFDISRLALNHQVLSKGSMQDGFSFVLSEDEEDPMIQVKQINTRAAMYAVKYSTLSYQKAKRADRDPSYQERGYNVKYKGRFIDVATLAHVLYSRKFSLDSLCKHLKLSSEVSKEDSRGHGRHLDEAYVMYAIKDVEATFSCLKLLRRKYQDYHLTGTPIEALFTEASVGKASLAEMMIYPLLQLQADIDPALLGNIMSTFYGGRSEIHLRRTELDGLYCDMLSMYPTVCTLMGLWSFVISQGLDHHEDTIGVKLFLESLLPVERGLEVLSKQETWKYLHCIVKVLPEDNVFPVRTSYAKGGDENIGINYVSSETPIWYTLPDCISSTLLTGRVPKVIEAIRFSPKGKQTWLKPINLLGKEEYRIDPLKDDMFKRLIEMRTNIAKAKMKAEKRAAKECHERGDLKGEKDHLINADIADSEQLSLKITANATSYGIYAEIIADKFEYPQEVEVYAHKEDPLTLTTQYREKTGKYFHPLLATLITGASRLLLAIAETLAEREGLTWAFCDTDSMTFTNPKGYSKEDFIERVKRIQSWYDNLNPYELNKYEALFKFEDYNYTDSGELEPLKVWCISAKRYVLYHLSEDNTPLIKKASVHGLGTYLQPYMGYKDLEKLSAEEKASLNPERDSYQDPRTGVTRVCISPFKDILPPIAESDLYAHIGVSRWEYDLWHCILQAERQGKDFSPSAHEGFRVPVRKMYSNSSPHLLNYYRMYNADKPYHQQVKPFNFYIASSPVDNPYWYEESYALQPSEREKPWEELKSLVRSLNGINHYGLPSYEYEALPHELKYPLLKTGRPKKGEKKQQPQEEGDYPKGVDFETFCTHLLRVSEEIELSAEKKQECYLFITSCYANHQVVRDYQRDPINNYQGRIHPIAVYDHEATAASQKWVDRDTLLSVDRALLTTYDRFLEDYNTHPENKFAHGETGDRGFTQRRHIKATALHIMGKEYRAIDDNIATEGRVPYGVRYSVNAEELTPAFTEELTSLPTSDIAAMTGLDRKTVDKVKKDPSSVKSSSLRKVYESVAQTAEDRRETAEEKQAALELLRKAVEKKGVRYVSQKVLSLSPSIVSRVLSGERGLSESMLESINTHKEGLRTIGNIVY